MRPGLREHYRETGLVGWMDGIEGSAQESWAIRLGDMCLVLELTHLLGGSPMLCGDELSW